MAVWPSIKINIDVARCQNLFNIVPEATEEWLEAGDNNKTIRYVSISPSNLLKSGRRKLEDVASSSLRITRITKKIISYRIIEYNIEWHRT